MLYHTRVRGTVLLRLKVHILIRCWRFLVSASLLRVSHVFGPACLVSWCADKAFGRLPCVGTRNARHSFARACVWSFSVLHHLSKVLLHVGVLIFVPSVPVCVVVSCSCVFFVFFLCMPRLRNGCQACLYVKARRALTRGAEVTGAL